MEAQADKPDNRPQIIITPVFDPPFIFEVQPRQQGRVLGPPKKARDRSELKEMASEMVDIYLLPWVAQHGEQWARKHQDEVRKGYEADAKRRKDDGEIA